MHRSLGILSVALLSFVLAACEGIDCTLNNLVTLNIGFYSSADGSSYALTDTLTVTAEGTDSVLYNRGTRTSSLSLPMSYWQQADTLNLDFYNDEESHRLTLRVRKSNTQHHESPDCPSTMFHTIEGVESEGAQGYIDSVLVVNTKVNYASIEHIQIYVHVAD